MEAYQEFMNDGREEMFVEECKNLIKKHGGKNLFVVDGLELTVNYCGLRHVDDPTDGTHYVEFLPYQDWVDFCYNYDFNLQNDISEEDMKKLFKAWGIF
jgi:hypothetical protein